jgi:hypothetical protein
MGEYLEGEEPGEVPQRWNLTAEEHKQFVQSVDEIRTVAENLYDLGLSGDAIADILEDLAEYFRIDLTDEE